MHAINENVLISGLIFDNYFQTFTLNSLIITTADDLFCSNFLYFQHNKRILHECSCFIEFIKRVGTRDKMRGLLSILSLFLQQV